MDSGCIFEVELIRLAGVLDVGSKGKRHLKNKS